MFVGRLESLGVRYMVTGSVASIFYGEPRLTHDINIVLLIGPLQVNRFIAAFPDEEYYCPPSEVIQIELKRGVHAHFHLIHHRSGLKADCYLDRRQTNFAIRRRASIQIIHNLYRFSIYPKPALSVVVISRGFSALFPAENKAVGCDGG